MNEEEEILFRKPKEVEIVIIDAQDTANWMCPSCTNTMLKENFGRKFKYCPMCGQCLSWEKWDKYEKKLKRLREQKRMEKIDEQRPY